MIGFTLSEKEFDYELQALATGFFPGKRTQINGCLLYTSDAADEL